MPFIRLEALTTVVVLACFSAFYFGEKGDVLSTSEQTGVGEMANLFQKIAQNVLLKAPAGPETTFGELWKDHRCVIVFFRRFG